MRENDEGSLYRRLSGLSDSDMLPLHMPGHKRRFCTGNMKEVFGIDITEIDGFDDLHDPTGVIRNMEERYAALYGADRAYLSVNGSTSCNEAAILSVCRPGDEVIIPRASHKSVYHAIEIGRLRPVYFQVPESEVAGIVPPPSVDEVKRALKEHPEASCVVITSPTYEGLTADIEGIAKAVHDHGGVLIVDAAHGAHMEICGAGQDHSGGRNLVPDDGTFSPGPLMQGADICVVSLHKMLPAPTQTALILVREGSGRDVHDRLRHYLDIFVSSSPSYVLMAGAGECLDYMEDRVSSDLDRSKELLKGFRTKCRDFKAIDVSLIREDDDPFKIVIRGKETDIPGQALYERLRTVHHIQCEMYGEEYVLALMSVMDDESSYERLYQALKSEDDILSEEYFSRRNSEDADAGTEGDYTTAYADAGPETVTDGNGTVDGMFSHIPNRCMDPWEAVNHECYVAPPDEEVVGCVSGSYVCVYPPGIPVIIPGEIIDKRVTDTVRRGLEKGLRITGMTDGRIRILGRKDNE